MTQSVNRAHWPAVAGALLTAAIFVVDLRLPPGYAGSMAYVLPVLVGLWVPGRRYVLVMATAGTVLSIATRLGVQPPASVPQSIVWMNRATSWFAIWITAGGILLYKAAQRAAEDERQRIRAIIETAVDGIVTIDERGVIELFNPAAERMFGWSARELVGRSLDRVIPAAQHEQPVQYLTRFVAGGAGRTIDAESEVLGRRKDGTTFPLEMAVAEVPLADQRMFTAILRDVTERREHDREREQMLRVLGDKNTELERFTYTVSHDLKSPLVTIKGFLGMLDRSATSGDLPQLRSDIARIGAAADRMRQLLDELLEISRIGRTIGVTTDVSLREVAHEALEAVGAAVRERGVTVEVASEMPVVRADRVRLRQVLQNLLDNAVKFLGAQTAPRIEVGARRDGAQVTCWVLDNGIGVDARYLEKVFGLFEKLDRDGNGTGIGLALVRRIIEVHGGRAWVESEGAGKGCRVCFTLPVSEVTGGDVT